NYRRLAAALSGLPGCRPLRPELPDETVPYVLPLLVDAPAQVFPALKQARVPVLRWEDMPEAALTACPVANRYRSALLQLPCHQALRSHEIDWIAAQVRAAVAAAGTGVPA
ncbi:MAG TPA: DegT/DnrJ/EryC1/StrS aminotransferase family protein, partial [Plasticicumulans sp.]|nr:DegT/DnrJ/EryC1/StrS aminotransferase family protein [Plasticicumulans sp.]